MEAFYSDSESVVEAENCPGRLNKRPESSEKCALLTVELKEEQNPVLLRVRQIASR